MVAETPVAAQQAWFSSNNSHALKDQEGEPMKHLFFDYVPRWNHTHVNVVVITPQQSMHAYQLDLSSGQPYYSHSYCSQSDVWRNFSGSIDKPIYSIAIIPRLLDQAGEPQRVLIFGGGEKIQNTKERRHHRVRLIGAAVEQSCPIGSCLGKSNWSSRIVLFAVDHLDKKFKNTFDMMALQEVISWNEIKASLENLDGHNAGGNSSYPSIKVGNPLSLSEVMKFYKQNSIFLDEKESAKIQKSCHALYEKLWQDVGVVRDEDKEVNSTEELKTRMKLIETLKKDKKAVGFAARFKKFASKYYSALNTCQKLVYVGNINKDQEKFWFWSYMDIFFRLHKDGYFFDCSKKSWQRNSLNSEGKPTFDLKTGLAECTDKDFDLAMAYLPNFLLGMKSSESIFYRFVDYDSQSFGSHQKMFSWVKLKSKKFDCSHDPNEAVRKQIRVFPEGVSWKKRENNDFEKENKIIY
jgi:hypothetical protein